MRRCAPQQRVQTASESAKHEQQPSSRAPDHSPQNAPRTTKIESQIHPRLRQSGVTASAVPTQPARSVFMWGPRRLTVCTHWPSPETHAERRVSNDDKRGTHQIRDTLAAERVPWCRPAWARDNQGRNRQHQQEASGGLRAGASDTVTVNQHVQLQQTRSCREMVCSPPKLWRTSSERLNDKPLLY